MYSEYFQDWELKPEFKKEFICIFDGWLGEENLHKLDEVTESEWQRFNTLIHLISKNYNVVQANIEARSIRELGSIDDVLCTYEESMNKDSERFTKLVVPQLQCVLTEEWDYTYILWHKNNGALEALQPLINKAGLYHWND